MKPNLTMHDIYVAVQNVLTADFDIVIQYTGFKIVYKGPLQLTVIQLLNQILQKLGFELSTLFSTGEDVIEMLIDELDSKESDGK